jgi:hypothetical protein
MKKCQDGFGYRYKMGTSSRYPDKFINDLDYADDIALLESSIARATEQLNRVSTVSEQVGLVINTDKTECMTFNIPAEHGRLLLQNREIKKVEDFKYLGSKVSSTESDFKNRKALAWCAYWKLEKIWKGRHIPPALKGKIFMASVISVLLYGCEAWIVSKELESKINSFATTCYRMWLGMKPVDRIRLDEIYKKVNQKPLIEILRQRQLVWVAHALRRKDNEPAKIFALYEPE